MVVVWSARAQRDRDNIPAHIALAAGPIEANACLIRIQRTIQFIAAYPEASRVVTPQGDRDRPVPRVPYIVRYRYQPRSQRIRIVRLLHGRQDRSGPAR